MSGPFSAFQQYICWLSLCGCKGAPQLQTSCFHTTIAQERKQGQLQQQQKFPLHAPLFLIKFNEPVNNRVNRPNLLYINYSTLGIFNEIHVKLLEQSQAENMLSVNIGNKKT